jgi:hypothetical protein
MAAMFFCCSGCTRELLQRGGAIPTALVVDAPALDAEDVEDLEEVYAAEQ